MDRRYSLRSAVWSVVFVGLLAGAASAADVPPRMLLLAAAPAESGLVAVGERGTILRSADRARTWRANPRVARAALTSVAFAPEGRHGWAVGHDGVILATSDGGRTWTKQFQDETLQDVFLSVLALDAQRVIAVGAYGLFAETRDGGKTWTKRAIAEEDSHFNRTSRGPTGTLYLAGERGTLLRSIDQGATWTPIRAPYEGSFYGVLPLDAQTLLAYGLRGHVFRSTDDGKSWQPVPTPSPVLLAAAIKLRDDAILIAGYAGTLLRSRDRGQSFASIDSPTKAIAELIELPDGSVLALGEEGATVMSAPK